VRPFGCTNVIVGPAAGQRSWRQAVAVAAATINRTSGNLAVANIRPPAII
jgi:hypothetical protein